MVSAARAELGTTGGVLARHTQSEAGSAAISSFPLVCVCVCVCVCVW